MRISRFAKKWGIIPPIGLFMLFPLTFSFAKLGFNFGPPILFISFRMILCGLLLLIYHFLTTEKTKPFSKDDWKLFFSASVIGIALSYISVNWALKHIAVAKASIIILSVPFFSLLFEYFHGFAKLTKNKIFGLFIGIIGITPILLQKTSTEVAFSISIYELAVIVAAASYSYGWIAVKQMIKKQTHPTVYINGLRIFFGGILALIASSFIEEWNGIIPPVTSWVNFLWYVSLASSIALICYSLYGFLLKHYTASMVAFCGFTEPLFAALYAWFLLGEKVSLIFFFSMIMVSFGLYVFSQETNQ